MVGIIDIHSHIVPDVDDGAKTLDESKQMLQLAYNEGIRTIIATPHFRRRMFECPLQKRKEQYEKLKEVAAQIGDGMTIIFGCECYADSNLIERLATGECCTIGNSSYVLTEFSERRDFAYVRQIIYDLVCNGYEPIVAHVERYGYLKKENIEELISLGAKMQINAESIIGKEGRKIKKFCKMMMKEGLLSFVATDAHGVKDRPPEIASCAAYIEKKMGKDYAKKILINNPLALIDQIKEGA